MAEQFLTLMADLDDASQARMSGWYDRLRKEGFAGIQTPRLPYHISLDTLPPDWEERAVEIARSAAAAYAPVPVHFSHIGLFAGGGILFAAPERNRGLDALQQACASGAPQRHPWTPHATILIDEPETVHAALPIIVESFAPFMARITRLHLCAFWPTREIAAFELTGTR